MPDPRRSVTMDAETEPEDDLQTDVNVWLDKCPQAFVAALARWFGVKATRNRTATTTRLKDAMRGLHYQLSRPITDWRRPDITIADVEPKLRRATMGPKGDRHDYAGAPLSCRESGVVLAELARLRADVARLELERNHGSELTKAGTNVG
jgi:hypothetical protein